ncbi:MAG: alpha-amylase family glycosyl hydrolase [Verrucomicrobiota bacterium]
METARPMPSWVRDGIVYEIFPRNFSTSGDFNGITAKLDELRYLGATILWLMPIHPNGKEKSKGTFGSPYAVRDFFAINADYGTKDDFKNLIAQSHQRGMKVIIDIVANHTSWDSVMMKNPEFYAKDASGKIIPPVADWYDVAQLNYKNPKLREYIIGMLKYWVQEFDLDGFRCDVAHMMPVDFWEQARVELTKVKSDLLLLAEASEPALLVKAFDMDYAWPFHGTLNRILLEGAPASDFKKSWDESHARFPKGSLHLRISDNHDEARAVARFGIKGALAASVLMLSLDGVPLLYNGMEVGDATESGAPALFEKLPIYWEPKERPPLRNIYRELIELRKKHSAFRNDRVIWLENSDNANVVSLMRLDQNDEFVIVINFSNRPMVGRVEVLNSGDFKQILPSAEKLSQGLPLFSLNGFEYRIFHRQVSDKRVPTN